ncbi:hypothetical protein SAMN04488144_13628 [Methylobacterium sp. 190mf]|uniref:MOSC domain-containing protein n=1 Tax=Methylobacterium sp. 190mf TaxID=1761798 RepID=UPI00089F68F7|nr:MOSC domain-containing protein [Methylobacterium sp. 190mf]SEG66712.1 hypothetical protein SAMN04488144_13628 [Methylobacterium sp. 190mf]
MAPTVSGLYHYPVKGLSAQALSNVRLVQGEGFPMDRIYGLARHDSGYDAVNYQPLPKTRFIVLVKEERLAGLSTFFDTKTHRLEIRVQGQLVLEENLDTEAGRRRLSKFFSHMFDLDAGKEPTIAVGGDNRFTDISVHSKLMMNAISLMNLNSVREFGARIDAQIDPMRFRANLYFDGLDAFQEFELLGREIEIGSARLRIFRRTRRCAATDVDPTTAERNMAIPRSLMKNYGHADMGVYAEVLEGGSVEIGSPVTIR